MTVGENPLPGVLPKSGDPVRVGSVKKLLVGFPSLEFSDKQESSDTVQQSSGV